VVDCVERRRRAELLASVSAPRAVAAALSFQACLRVYICTCCMCVRICVCMYVYRRACMYVYACTSVYVFVCMYIRVYMYVYAYLCIGCESLCQSLCVLGDVTNARVCPCAYVCVRMCVCTYIYVHFFALVVVCTLDQVFWALVQGQVCMLHGCFFYINIHIREHTR